jgi:hypothetical protein
MEQNVFASRISYRRRLFLAALLVFAALALSACLAPAPRPTPQPSPDESGVVLPDVGITPRPALTAEPTTGATAQPTVGATPQPAPAATTQPTPLPVATDLVGPGWMILERGALSGGPETVIAAWPSGNAITPQLPPEYSGYTTVTEQVVVVERNVLGQPWVRLQISLNGLFFNGDNTRQVVYPGLPDTRTIAMAVKLERPSMRINVIPLDAAGKPTAAGIVAFGRDGGMVVEPLPAPITPLTPLVGPEWTILAQGDLYGDGAETVVAYSRSGMEPAQAQLPPQYVGFGLVAERLVIVQRNANGQPWVRVLVSPGGVFLNGDNQNPVFPPGGPNSRTQGFAVALEHFAAPVRMVPLGTDGRPVETGFVARYEPGSRSFTLSELVLPGGPTETALVSGRVAYPAGGAPPLEVWALDIDNPERRYRVETELNAPVFTFVLPAGRYHLLAYTLPGATPELTGGYTEYMRCGERLECSDHTLVALTVQPNQTWSDLVIGDWFAPAGTFPPRP